MLITAGKMYSSTLYHLAEPINTLRRQLSAAHQLNARPRWPADRKVPLRVALRVPGGLHWGLHASVHVHWSICPSACLWLGLCLRQPSHPLCPISSSDLDEQRQHQVQDAQQSLQLERRSSLHCRWFGSLTLLRRLGQQVIREDVTSYKLFGEDVSKFGGDVLILKKGTILIIYSSNLLPFRNSTLSA